MDTTMKLPSLPALGVAFGAALLLTSTAAAQCPGTDDAFEDNDSCAAPWVIGPGNYPGLYTEKEALDPDYFQISVPNNNFVVVTITFSHAQADTDLALYDSGCANLLDSSASITDSETVMYLNNSGATMDVIADAYVYVNAGNDCNNYTMDIQIFPDPCSTATDDALEDNDDCATAISNITGFVPGLFVSKTDYDYYAYTLADGETIDASTFFTHADGDIDIALYDTANCGTGFFNGLAYSVSTDDDENLSYTNTSGAAMPVILEVIVYSGSGFDCNNYDLDVTISGGSGPIGTNYCGPANMNSSGMSAVISAFGSTAVASNDVRLDASQMALNQFGMFVNSMSTGMVMPPGSQGNLCLSGAIGRHSQNILNTGATGAFSLQLDLTNIPTPNGHVAIQAGETWYWQAWFRDANPMSTSNFTDGIGITFN